MIPVFLQGVGPIQVKYVDGKRERLGFVEYKLYVGSLNKQATEEEVEQVGQNLLFVYYLCKYV
ncbi:hypothetical protein HanRHA438_Chr02g0085721 [Helianthus annuus]|nr:hypothetical protein HanIR_Chr02g0087011 [Helianthus annuus]KAJ0777816.1 hypothetical protein HanLR1_Chr02g0064791 [Helianthus annuus]KAJ0786829.1 hypothetical protein HanOQP8_Chr02g0075741 [Helianthus annuus]KAJ0940645.1 hypothetical protein HanRHA438_Chr02g0085721 [Helianthus annuus]KAJ0952410.1 hypothetical protein HanPSC8_Chr02g0071891 [Helianthus annuus]